MKTNFLSVLNSTLRITIFGVLSLYYSTTNTFANIKKNELIEEILIKAEKAFNEANTKEDQFEIISLPISCKYHRGKKRLENNYNLFENGKYNINVLALAIAHADLPRTQKFLEIVDDINNESLWISGFNEEYTLAHAALNPAYFGCYNWDNNQRFKIIQLLANKNIDFNKVIPTLKMQYTLLEETDLTQYPLKERKKLLIFALLNGADFIMQQTFFEPKDFSDHHSDYFITMFGRGLYNGFDKLNPETRNILRKGHEDMKQAFEDAIGYACFDIKSKL